jgi:hypothetical protein
MSDISQYLSDHGHAGHCAFSYYNGTHDQNTCQAPPGVCSVIAYLVAELKNAEYYYHAAVTPATPATPSYQPPVVETRDPLTDPGFKSGGTGNDSTTYQFPTSGTGIGSHAYSGDYANGGNGSAYPTGNGRGGNA